jgi:hypothetical protein
VHTQELCTTRSDGTEVCASADQFAAILAGTSAGASPYGDGQREAPASLPVLEDSYTDTATTTTPSETAPSGSAAVPAANDEAAAGSGSDVADAPDAATGGSSALEETGADTDEATPQRSHEPVPEGTPELAPADDNQPTDPLPATGTQ